MFNFFKKSKKVEKNKNIQNKPIVFQDEQAKDVVLQIKPNGNDTLFEIINLKENNSILLNKEQCILVATALFEYGKTGNIIKTVSIIYDESEEKNG
jgi:hypothetical protein